jgi:hypothetical protein
MKLLSHCDQKKYQKGNERCNRPIVNVHFMIIHIEVNAAGIGIPATAYRHQHLSPVPECVLLFWYLAGFGIGSFFHSCVRLIRIRQSSIPALKKKNFTTVKINMNKWI